MQFSSNHVPLSVMLVDLKMSEIHTERSDVKKTHQPRHFHWEWRLVKAVMGRCMLQVCLRWLERRRYLVSRDLVVSHHYICVTAWMKDKMNEGIDRQTDRWDWAIPILWFVCIRVTYWKVKPVFIFIFLAETSSFCAKISWYVELFLIPAVLTGALVPAEERRST